MSSPKSMSKNLLYHNVLEEVRSAAPVPGARLTPHLRQHLESLEKAERKEIVSIVGLDDKCSPLFIACRKGNLEIVEYLIETCGADVEQKGNYEVEGEDTCEGVTPLWCAAVSGKLGIVKCLIEKYGANVNAISATGSTPVRSACYMNHEDVVHYLVDHAGADINLPNFAGVTCLMNAVQSSALCEYLLAHGADVNAKDVNKYTALHYAIQDQHFDTIKLLIAHGADPYLKNDDGDDAFRTSCLKGATSIFSYLLFEIPSTISRKRAAELHELMGSTFLDEHHDIQMALKYWREGIDIRYNPKHRKLPKEPLGYSPLYATYVNHLGIEVEISEFNTKEELENIATDLEEMRVNSLLIAERILGVYHKDMISRIMNRGAAYADSSQYLMCIHLWRYALQLRIQKDSLLDGDTCFTALELIRLYLDLDRNPDLDRNANDHPLKVADLMGTFQQLVEQFPTCEQLVKVRPVFNRQQECFDRCLRCCAHLLYLLIRAPNKTQEESFQLRKMAEKLVSYRLRMCGTGDSLLHIAVSKEKCVRSHFFVNDYQEEVFPSEDVTKYLTECGADVNATNVSGLTALDVASLSENYNATIIEVLKNGVQVNNDTKGDESSVTSKTTTIQSEFSDFKAFSDILHNEVRSERLRAVARRRLIKEDRKEGEPPSVVTKATTVQSESPDIKASSDILHKEVRSEQQRVVARRHLKKEDWKEGDPTNVVTKATTVQSESPDIKASSDILHNEVRSERQKPGARLTDPLHAHLKNLLQHQVNVEVRSAAPGASLTSLLRKNLESFGIADRKEIVSIVEKEDNCSPLFIACRKGNLEIVEYLIETCGADVEQKGNYEEEGEDTCEGVSPLWCAAVSGKLDIVKCLVEKYGANVNAISATGSTPVRSACFDTQEEIVRYLVDHAGADINLPNFYGGTCLMTAVQSPAICEYLLNHGADVNVQGLHKCTALHYAIREQHFDTIKLLISRGADPFLKNDDGDDAFQTSCLVGAEEIFTYLLSTFQVSRERQAELHELMGSYFLIVSKEDHEDMEVAVKYWKRSIEIRYDPKRELPDIPKKRLRYTPSYATPNLANDPNISLEFLEFDTLEDLCGIVKSGWYLVSVNCLLVTERILGPLHPDTITRIIVKGTTFRRASSLSRMTILLWRCGLQRRIQTLTLLHDDTCSTILALIRMYSMGHIEETDRTSDLLCILQNLYEQLPECMELLKVRPIFKKQEEYFDRCLAFCTYLLHLLIRAPDKTPQETFQLKELIEKLVQCGLTTCTTGDTLLHLAVSKGNVIRSESDTEQRPQEEIFPSEDVTKYLIECGADANAMNASGLTALDVASLSENYNATVKS